MLRCPKDDEELIIESEDNRQEWTKTYYVCPACGLTAERYTQYDQNGLVEKDEVEYSELER